MPPVVLTGGQHGPLREIIEHGPHSTRQSETVYKANRASIKA
jgi:hypothetical protein